LLGQQKVRVCSYEICRVLTLHCIHTDLPDHADMIIDALSDNETGAKRNRYDTAIAEAVSWTLSCTPDNSDDKTPITSIDLPSNTDPDTGKYTSYHKPGGPHSNTHYLLPGYPATGAIWSINPSAVVSLGLVKAPSATAKYSVFLIDIGLPLVRYRTLVHERQTC
jgi:NAD(P)H-hydrate repair Nnr-like enzyme with NAD(P)H-hydrate epimerase domain